MDQEYETYIIPANVTDNGNVINGNIKKKNAYEAAAILFVGVIFCFILLGFLHLIPKLIIFTVFVMLSLVAVVGIKGDSLIETLLEAFFFNKKKRTMKYRLPRKDTELKAKKRLRKEK